MTRRRFFSLLRVFTYGALGLAAYYGEKSANTAVSGAVVGFLMADIGTWLLWEVRELPNWVLEGAWDAVVNTVGILLILHFTHLKVPQDDMGVVSAWGTLMVVLVVKSFFYAVGFLDDSLLPGGGE